MKDHRKRPLKPLLEITAKHQVNKKTAVVFFKSIAQAEFYNPELTDFRIVGVADEKIQPHKIINCCVECYKDCKFEVKIGDTINIVDVEQCEMSNKGKK